MAATIPGVDSILPGLLSLFVLIALNAFFVFSEYSVAVSRRTRIAELAEQGSAPAQVVSEVMRDPDRFFAATQIGITLTSMAIGALSEPSLSFLFGSAFGALPLPRELTSVIGAVVGLVIASFFQIVLAELVPRSITLRAAERVATLVVPTMNVLALVFRPFALLLKTSSRVVLRLIGIRPEADYERVHSAAELRMLVEESEKAGALEPDQRRMLDNVFTFGDTTVREVMNPRTELVGIETDTPLADVVHTFTRHTFNRLPVFQESLDNIVGVIHLKDVLPALMSSRRGITARQLLRPQMLVVPDTQRADEVLQQMRAQHESFAIVLDEYGGTAGVVTLNDLLSELVGEIGDSAQPAVPNIQTSADGSALVNGLTTLGDLNEKFDLALSDDNYDTVGGYVMGRLGRIPAIGDEIAVDANAGPRGSARFRVEEMDRRRVAKVRLIFTPAAPASA